MSFEISVPSADEASAVADVHLLAMKNDVLTKVQFPTPEAWEFFRGWLGRNTMQHTRDADKGVLVARDRETGEVASFIKWLVHPSGGDEAVAENVEGWSDVCEVKYLTSYGALTKETRKRVMGKQPYYRQCAGERRKASTGYWISRSPAFVCLGVANAATDVTFLCTHPKWSRRGAASSLLKQVQDLAAADEKPIILEGTMNAVALYQRMGFVVMETLKMKLPVGGSSEPEEEFEERSMVWRMGNGEKPVDRGRG